jgi:hypothetical protein
VSGLEEVEWFDLTEMILSHESVGDSTETVDMLEWYDTPTMIALKDPFAFDGEATEADRRMLGGIVIKNSIILSDNGSVVLTTNYVEKLGEEVGSEQPTVEEIEFTQAQAPRATTWLLRRPAIQTSQVDQLPWINLKQIII